MAFQSSYFLAIECVDIDSFVLRSSGDVSAINKVDTEYGITMIGYNSLQLPQPTILSPLNNHTLLSPTNLQNSRFLSLRLLRLELRIRPKFLLIVPISRRVIILFVFRVHYIECLALVLVVVPGRLEILLLEVF